MRRIKIIKDCEAGSVVNQVNSLLADDWQILSEHATSVSVTSQMMVPCFVVFLVKEDKTE